MHGIAWRGRTGRRFIRWVPYCTVRPATERLFVERLVFVLIDRWVDELRLRAAPPFASFEGLRSRTFTSFFFVAILFLSPVFAFALVDVSRTEEQLTAARDVSLGNQIIELEQLSVLARWLLNL